MITKIYKRDGSQAPFDKARITNAIYKASSACGGHDIKEARRLTERVVDILEYHFPGTIPSVEEIQDVVEKVLIEEGHVRTAKAYILYRKKRKELREKKEKKEIENIPYKRIWQVLLWNLEHSCETVDKLNEHIKVGTFPKLIKDSEKDYEEEISNLASLIAEDFNRGKFRLFIVAGPSSSGKTTTTRRLGQKLKRKNINFLELNIDNYFYNLRYHLKDGYGDYDFEGPYALDIPLINEHLDELLRGKVVKVPVYNFKTGYREAKTTPLRLKSNQVLLVDSHFGLYPQLTESVPRKSKVGLYLETLCQLREKNGRFVRWTDIRMLRRMIRDIQFRKYNPVQTVGHWHYVRQGELKNIIPYISEADYVLNTSLPYELPILKHCLFRLFPSIIKTYEKDSARQDAYIRAERVYRLLKSIKEWKDTTLVPKDSILREFIG